MGIKSIRIQNFKSIRDSGEVELRPINVLIGPNGAGKSNFIGFFKLLNRLYERQLQLYVNRNGRADSFLYFGRKISDSLEGTVIFWDDDDPYYFEYGFSLAPDQSGGLFLTKERLGTHPRYATGFLGGQESLVKTDADGSEAFYAERYLGHIKVFHFHDTSFNAKVKQPSNTTDYAYLHEDADNLAAFLYRLQEKEQSSFRMIVNVIQSIAPFFDQFYLQPDEINSQQIFLRWREKGSEQLFNAHSLSDGTLRMICLTTLLLQPNPPATIIIDEPELGLHPFAIAKLAAMLKSASKQAQIIISTQSVTLLDHFEASDVIVAERVEEQDGRSETVFKRQSEESLHDWLQEYTLGQLWEKNVIGGRP